MLKEVPTTKYGPKRETLLLSLLAVIIILIYTDILTAPFIFDDLNNIHDNRHIRIPSLSFENLVRAGFHSPEARRPVANISFALNFYFNSQELQAIRQAPKVSTEVGVENNTAKIKAIQALRKLF